MRDTYLYLRGVINHPTPKGMADCLSFRSSEVSRLQGFKASKISTPRPSRPQCDLNFLLIFLRFTAISKAGFSYDDFRNRESFRDDIERHGSTPLTMSWDEKVTRRNQMTAQGSKQQ